MNKIIIGQRILADKAKIIELYKADVFVAKIAVMYGVGINTIYNYLRRWGVPHKRKPYQLNEKKAVKKDYSNFSPELKARMALNSQVNNKIEGIEYFKSYDNRFVKKG
jgi:transposase